MSAEIQRRRTTALRWRQDVLARSSVGAIVTDVERHDGTRNTVVGADASCTFIDHLNISALGARATDDELEEGKFAGQLRVGWETEEFRAIFDVLRIDSFTSNVLNARAIVFGPIARQTCQFSARRPMIRENSRTLAVTSTHSCARAMDAMSRSLAPIGSPRAARSCRIVP